MNICILTQSKKKNLTIKYNKVKEERETALAAFFNCPNDATQKQGLRRVYESKSIECSWLLSESIQASTKLSELLNKIYKYSMTKIRYLETHEHRSEIQKFLLDEMRSQTADMSHDPQFRRLLPAFDL